MFKNKQNIFLEALRTQVEQRYKTAQEMEKYNKIKSLCITCKNAYIYKYIPNPLEKSEDPITVCCKLPYWKNFWQPHYPDCYNDVWNRKCLECSEYKKKGE